MGKIDKLIQAALVRKTKNVKMDISADCPSDIELANYISGDAGQARDYIEKHLADCFVCLDKLVFSYEGNELLKKRRIKKAPRRATWKAKNIDRLSGETIKNRVDTVLKNADMLPRTKKLLETEKVVIKWLPKNLKKNKWLIASITAFALSFAFPPVFLQFLLAAGILGGKWIFDSENARTLIMIYNAWKKGGKEEVGEMLEILKDRIPNKR